MATRYWVAGGNGLWSSITNWSTTSGGTSGASVPTSADRAQFNSLSGSGTATVDSSVIINDLQMGGFTGTLAFGTNTISVAGSGTVFNGDSTFSVTGTPVINVTYTGATGVAVSSVSPATEANSISFNFTSGTYTLTFLSGTGSTAKNVNFTGFSGTWTRGTGGAIIYGSLTFSTGMSVSTVTGSLTFGATSGTQDITFTNKTINFPVIMNSPGATLRFIDNPSFSAPAPTLTNGTLDFNYRTIGNQTWTMTTGSVVIKNTGTPGWTFNITQSSGTLTLGSDCVVGGTYTLTAGTLDLGGYGLTCGIFSSSNSNVRTIAFGTGSITCVTTGGTIWTTATTTNLTVTGTPVVNISYSGALATTVSSGILTEAQAISFNFTAGTYSLIFLATASYAAKNVNFTGFAGTWAARANAATIYGSLTLSSGMTFAASSGVLTLGATSGTQIITTNGKTFDQPITINGVGGTVQLADALTMGATRALTLTNGTFDGNSKTISGASSFTMVTGSITAKNISTALAFTHTSGSLTQGAANTFGAYTLTAGTLDLGGYQLSCATFNSNNINTRTLAFGISNITCTSSGTVWTTDTITGLTITGTPVVNVTSSGLSAITVAAGALTEAQSISFNFTGGTYTLTYSGSGNNMNFTSFGGAFLLGSASTIYGNWTIPTGSTMTTSASAVLCTFGATSGTKTIKTSGVALNFPITFNGAGGTWQLQDNLTVGSSTTVSTRTTTHTQGTLDLNNFQLISGLWNGGSGLTRTLAFGTSGSVKVIGSGSIIQNNFCTTILGFNYTGTSLFYISNNSATASDITVGAPTEAVSMNYLVNVGTYAITMFSGSSAVKNLDFTGFSGTFSGVWNALSVYGNLTFSATAGAPAASGNLVTFRATSGTQLFTSNGKTLDFPITVNGAGGTVKLADALTMGATRALTLTNGTFDGNSKTISGASSFTMVTGSVTAKNISTALAFTHTSGTLTQGANNSTGTYTITAGTLNLAGFNFTTTSFVTAVGTKNLTFNGGTLTVTDATTTAFNNAQPTGFTTTAGTGTGKISMTAATAKTFVGGGSTFSCTLSNDGAGALTISGSNTFTTIANGVQPTAFTFTSSTTQTVTNWTVSGTAGNLVTIISSTAGTAATLSKASGTVSSDYLSLKDSAATGGAAWYAGANSTNVSGNSGWIFTAPPVITAGGNFFFMF